MSSKVMRFTTFQTLIQKNWLLSFRIAFTFQVEDLSEKNYSEVLLRILVRSHDRSWVLITSDKSLWVLIKLSLNPLKAAHFIAFADSLEVLTLSGFSTEDLVEVRKTDLGAFYGLTKLRRLCIHHLVFELKNLRIMQGGSEYPLLSIGKVFISVEYYV